MDLAYRTLNSLEDLTVGCAAIRSAKKDGGVKWWMLWICVATRDSPTDFVAVPVDTLRPYHEDGPHGRTWGLSRAAEGVWVVSPSIDVKESAAAGAASVWHENVRLVGVPLSEPWMGGPPP
jgi:hypothetical protein